MIHFMIHSSILMFKEDLVDGHLEDLGVMEDLDLATDLIPDLAIHGFIMASIIDMVIALLMQTGMTMLPIIMEEEMPEHPIQKAQVEEILILKGLEK